MPYKLWTKRNAALVLDSIDDVILITDSEALVGYANRAAGAMFDCGHEELRGRRLDDLISGAGPSALLDGVLTNVFESSGIRSDSARFPVLCTINELKSNEGARYALVIRDLSAQYDLQASLHAQRELLARAGRLSTLGEMTASIAHEINQPLTAIAMYAHSCERLLQQNPVDSQKVLDALQRLSEQALRAGSISERIQGFVARQHHERGLHNMNELLLDLEPLAVGDARISGVSLKYELAAELPQVVCSAINIQQILLNLLRNAFDAMSIAGAKLDAAVVVSSRQVSADEGAAVRVSVADQGTGIDETVEPRLFAPFQTTKKNGVGLGLSTCRTLISEEGGELGYENRPGSGATFWFSLPVPRASGDDLNGMVDPQQVNRSVLKGRRET